MKPWMMSFPLSHVLSILPALKSAPIILCFSTYRKVRRSFMAMYYISRYIRSTYGLTMREGSVRLRMHGSKYKIVVRSCRSQVGIWGRIASNVLIVLVRVGSSLVGEYQPIIYINQHSDVVCMAGVVYYSLYTSLFTSCQRRASSRG